VLSRCTIVLDVGKTNAKLTLWDAEGRLLQRRVRPNERVSAPGYQALDAAGLEDWLAGTLSEFAREADVGTIVPVAHGAAAALVSHEGLFTAPMDYEDEATAEDRAAYERGRDSFTQSGSPSLPQGLNLGMQLHRLERLTAPWPEDVRIVTWPQYWAWRLCDVMATEVTSLGCHSDLWRPRERTYSDLARSRGWAQRMAPLRRAGEPLAAITAEWATRTGLPRNCLVLCGLHDSNAALLAARGHAEIADNDATVLSTGTWFVAMRSPSAQASIDTSTLAETRDCLINVDVQGRPVPSARFMGGREAELIAGLDTHALTDNYDPQRLIDRLPALLESGAVALPTFARGFGPFARAIGEWRNKPVDAGDQRAITGLYLALMADASLDLIGSRERLLIEGRFAEAVIFIRALAALRPEQKLYVSNAHNDVPYGALRLVQPALPPSSPLMPVEPLPVDFRAYARQWREHAARSIA
jgi:sugar (pentulose or hexulose) kinase